MASFQDNLARPIVECQIILHFAAPGDDGTAGGGNNQNYKMMQSSNHITMTYILRFFTGWKLYLSHTTNPTEPKHRRPSKICLNIEMDPGSTNAGLSANPTIMSQQLSRIHSYVK